MDGDRFDALTGSLEEHLFFQCVAFGRAHNLDQNGRDGVSVLVQALALVTAHFVAAQSLAVEILTNEPLDDFIIRYEDEGLAPQVQGTLDKRHQDLYVRIMAVVFRWEAETATARRSQNGPGPVASDSKA